jgi:hypothetical protein
LLSRNFSPLDSATLSHGYDDEIGLSSLVGFNSMIMVLAVIPALASALCSFGA